MYIRPKDSNATVGVRNRATGKALEGADRQTERQTLSTHYNKIYAKCIQWLRRDTTADSSINDQLIKTDHNWFSSYSQKCWGCFS